MQRANTLRLSLFTLAFMISSGCATVDQSTLSLSDDNPDNPIDVEYSESRALTLTDVARVSHVDTVIVDEDGEKIFFEYRDRREWEIESVVPNGLPADYFRKIYSMPVRPEAPPKRAFDQKDECGYILVSDEAISPTSQYLAFFEMCSTGTRLGVHDLKAGSVKYQDFDIFFSPGWPTFIWTGENQFAALASIEGESVNPRGLRADIANFRLQSEAQQRAVSNSDMTASVVGAGAFVSLTVPPTEYQVVLSNMETNRVTVLSQGRFYDGLIASPSGRFLALLSDAEPNKPNIEQPISVGTHPRSKRLEIIDLLTGQSVTTSNNMDVAEDLISWSDDEQKLLFFASTINEPKSEGSFHVLHFPSKRIQNLGVSGIASGGRYADRGFNPQYIPHAYWIGESIVYPSITGDGWVAIDTDGNQSAWGNLSGSLPARPVAKNRDGLVYLTGGSLVTVTESGEVSDFSSEMLPGLRPATFFRSRLSRSERMNGLDDIENVLFAYSMNESDYFVTFDELGARAFFESDHSWSTTIKNYRNNNGVFVQHSNEQGSRLLSMLTHGNSLDSIAGESLFEFNKHFSAIAARHEAIPLRYPDAKGNLSISWLFMPHSGSDDKLKEKYPLVVIPYAGTVYTDDIPKEGLWRTGHFAPISPTIFNNNGYAVLLPSVPSSTASGDPMVDVVDPVGRAIEAAVAMGRIDDSMIAVSGHSFGAYNALSLAVSELNFHAVIASAVIANPISGYGQFSGAWRFGSLEIQRVRMALYELGQFGFGTPPWSAKERYIRNTPIFFAENIDAPVMLIQGDLDSISMSQSEEMFTALSRQGKDVLFVRYWGERHGIQSPRNYTDMWARVFDFLEDNGVTPGPKTVH